MRRPLTLKRLSMENIRKRPFRSICLILLVAVFTATMVIGSLISMSLHRGVESLTNRLGADLIVAPFGYKSNVEGVLLNGKPTDVFMPPDSLEKLSQFSEIDIASPQLYITTLKASCCSYPVQLIGFDEKTDFLVKPWLEDIYDGELGDDEVIIGDKVPSAVGETVRYLGRELKVVGKLERTGIGFDACVFLKMETAKEMATSSKRLKQNYDETRDDLISLIMVKLKPGVDVQKTTQKITDTLKEDRMYAFNSQSFARPVAENLRILNNYIKVGIVALWVIFAVLIFLIFLMLVGERRKEMGVFRVLGASRAKLRRLILTEAFLISLIGALVGVGLGTIRALLALPKLSSFLTIPYLIPTWPVIFGCIVGAFCVGVLMGPLASYWAARKLSKVDVQVATRGY